MNEQQKRELAEVVAVGMNALKKEHSDLSYQILKEIRDSREDFHDKMAEHKLEDQKNFAAIDLKINTLQEQTAPIRNAWAQAIKYGVAIALGALGIKMMK